MALAKTGKRAEVSTWCLLTTSCEESEQDQAEAALNIYIFGN
jgi:hypothetical protein